MKLSDVIAAARAQAGMNELHLHKINPYIDRVFKLLIRNEYNNDNINLARNVPKLS